MATKVRGASTGDGWQSVKRLLGNGYGAILYSRNPDFTDRVAVETVANTHAVVSSFDPKNGNITVYGKMQAEIWSPRGEARALIRSLGLRHTSMSVGDAILRPVAGSENDPNAVLELWAVCPFRFRLVGTIARGQTPLY